MHILILGAGVVGVTSAWYLARAGHRVTVLERQPGAALETSFANGGQISVSHAEPWANPRALSRALHWLGREDAPLLIRAYGDPKLLSWLLRFLRECPSPRVRANIRAIVSLALYSRRCLQTLREEMRREGGAIDYDHLERGILHLYTDDEEFAAALGAAALMREFGCERRVIGLDECLKLEPALEGARRLLVGADYTADDESGDAHRFTRELAQRCAALGVEFCYGVAVRRLRILGGLVEGVEIDASPPDETIHADAYIIAAGSETPRLLSPLGIRVPIYPAKGYSATIPLSGTSVAPSVSLTDDGHKLVFSRLGQRLRVAGTAEFNRYDKSLNPERCAALMRRTLEFFPALAPAEEPAFWCGLRPATPSNVPLIGNLRAPNLWINSGHGTLGWTLSCGSGAALADLIGGRRPEPEFPFLSAGIRQ
ncbi:MAG: D-amino acid dehydrogenase [Betaproteobacteria bacterium]|nr:D-amino acid dehydrogenase [Betaproteobacteria bacterium]